MARTEAHPQVSAPQRLTFMTMTAMVVGSMVGAGVFLLPRRFAQETGVAGALIAWVIAGTGMLMLAFVFQTSRAWDHWQPSVADHMADLAMLREIVTVARHD